MGGGKILGRDIGKGGIERERLRETEEREREGVHNS